MPKRVIMKIDLSSSAHDGLDATVERFGMTKVAAVSRLVEWFHGLPSDVQFEILTTGFRSQAEAQKTLTAALKASRVESG